MICTLKMPNMRSSKKLYLNPKQRQFLLAKQKTRVFLGGRGSGKSHEIGVIQRKKAGVMPRSKGFLASTTYNQILTKTLPAIISAWESMGLVENVHYIVGRKPPKYFETPYSPPKKYANVISFMNGRTIEMISMDRPDLARGGSYDDGDIDEAALLKKTDWTRILLPSIRGNTHRFRTHWHQMVGFYTSLPWEPSGYWLFEYEERAKAKPDKYIVIEANAYDNIHILTEEGIERMREEMTNLEFQIEVMNRRVIQVEDCFYHGFTSDKHLYTPQYVYGEGETGITVEGIKDHTRDAILETSFDFSGWFNCCTVWQQQGMIERMINSFHVKGDEKLGQLIKNFCEYYRAHQFKVVRVWGEPRGHDKQALTPSIYESIVSMFASHGWKAEIKAHAGRTRLHQERYQFVNDVLLERAPALPRVRINRETCKAVVIAIQTTQVKDDFQKDKSKEKERDFPQEHAPHYTDTIDYYVMQKHGWRLTNSVDHGAGQAIFI